LMVMETLRGETLPVGVPGLVGPPPPPVLLPPPQLALARIDANKTAASANRQGRSLRLRANASANSAQSKMRIVVRGAFDTGAVGLLREAGATPEAAVLEKVRVAVAVPFAGRVKELSEQVISSEAEVPQVEEEKPPVPVRPFWLVKVRVVETDWPGEEMDRAAGFAVTENVGPVTASDAPDVCDS